MNQSKQQILPFIFCRYRLGLGRTAPRKFSIRGHCVCAGWLDILKIDNAPLIYSVSSFNLGGLELLLED